ncbi:MAG: hypothetical protein ABII97_02560 [Patescibacteria group bacterium]
MKSFKAIYRFEIDDGEAGMACVDQRKLNDWEFCIKANSLEDAMDIAYQYEDLEVQPFEFIGVLKEVVEISKKEAKRLEPITTYEDNMKEKHETK